MAKIEFKGIDAYISALTQLETQTVPVIKRAVYDGVAVGLDEIASAIENVSSAEKRPGPDGIANYEKAAMLEGLGTSHIANDEGFINGKIGFHGYYMHNGRKLPIPMIARAVNSGTSFMRKNPVIKKATRAAKPKIIAAMDATVYKEIKNIMEEK